MKDGFIRVAADSVAVTVADPDANAAAIRRCIDAADSAGVHLLVLPELCVSGYTCGDLLYSDTLLARCQQQLTALAAYTADKYPITVVGVPLSHAGKLYNCAAVLANGQVLGIVPKTFLPAHSEFHEQRQFVSGATLPEVTEYTLPDGSVVPFGTGLRFALHHADRKCKRYGAGSYGCKKSIRKRIKICRKLL